MIQEEVSRIRSLTFSFNDRSNARIIGLLAMSYENINDRKKNDFIGCIPFEHLPLDIIYSQ